MAPKRDKKPAPVANRDDAFGPAARTRSACSASSVASSLQDLSLSSDRVQLPTPTAQAHDSTLIDSATTGVLSLPKSTAGSRHGFRMAISYRKVTAKDEVGDRRRRQRDGLMSKTADTSSSIYRARYESLPVDTALDDAYLPPGEGEEEDGTGGLEANEEVASKTQEPLAIPETGLGASGTPRRTNETSLNARAARNKEIEEELLKASEDRLNPDMLDIEPSDDMSESERALWDRLVGDLVKEMETPSTPLGKLVKKIHGNHSSDTRGEDELAKQFADFCNYVAQRLAYAVLGQYAHGVSGLFRFSGNRFMKDGHVPHPGSGKAASDNKLDIIVNGENTEDDDDVRWDHALTFGQVKLRLSSDPKDVLIGQMLRYLRKILQNHPISGRNVCFSLCGHLLRIFETDPVKLSTSPAYSFKEPKDYRKIICAIALLSGPAFLVSEQWEPSPQNPLFVRKADNRCVEYRLVDIQRLAVSPVIWGSRTAAWSAVAKQVGEVDDVDIRESLPLVIKSTWLTDRLYDHELEIVGHIDGARNKCLADGSVPPLLPFPVGHAINTIPGTETQLDNWRTADGRIRNTTLVTFCEKGRHVDQDRLTVRSHVRFHRSLTKTLGWLAKSGIHYRDLNNGNVLRSAAGSCVLIDFGNARYLKRPRGRTGDQPVEPLDLSMDDARSGTLMFMSRRIHALTEESNRYKEAVKEYNREAMELENPNAPFRSRRIAKLEDQKRELEKMQEDLQRVHNQHCYIDDAESQLYLMMEQALRVSDETAQFHRMEELEEKKRYWKKISPLHGTKLIGTEWIFFEDVALKMRREIERTLEKIRAGLDDQSLDASQGTAFDCETDCYDLLDEIWAEEEARLDEEESRQAVEAS